MAQSQRHNPQASKRPGGGGGKGSGPKGRPPDGNGKGRWIQVLPETTQKAVEAARSNKQLLVHPALELSKFVGWRQDGNRLEADREAWQHVLQSLSRAQAVAQAWLARRRAWVAALGDRARTIQVQAISPCVLWLAAPTPLELGFCLHHTYGLPYLPGSGLKGLARAAMLRELSGVPVLDVGAKGDTRAREEEKAEPKEVTDLFGLGGDRGHAGIVDFLDGIPLSADCLEREVMSPHHAQYYQGNSKIPHDCEDPIPLQFLRIRPGSKFEIALVSRDSASPGKWLEQATQYLLLGLSELGVGAKTSSGYGLFRQTTPISTGPSVQGPESTSSIAQGEAKSLETGEIHGAVVDRFDTNADLLVFRDPQGNTFQASIKECETRFSIKRSSLNQLRKDRVRFRISVRGDKVIGVYKE